MELLYVWINYSKHGIFQKQGINLSPEYNFTVEIRSKDVVFSKDETWHGREVK